MKTTTIVNSAWLADLHKRNFDSGSIWNVITITNFYNIYNYCKFWSKAKQVLDFSDLQVILNTHTQINAHNMNVKTLLSIAQEI